MDVSIWLFLLYGAIAVLALRSLLTLMEQHKRVHYYLLKKQAKKEAKKKIAMEAEQNNAAEETARQENKAA